MTEQQAPENCSSTAVHPRVQRAELAVLSGWAGPTLPHLSITVILPNHGRL